MSVFKFRHFHIHQAHSALKVGTDSMLLGSLCKWENPKRLLDIGTGTGVLALMCAQRFSLDEITGIELSADAVKDARINAQNNPFSSRISIVNQAIQDYESTEGFDAIISNPPFFENSSKNPNEHKALARHTEHLPFTELIAAISRLLSDNGKAWIILPIESKEQIIQLGSEHNLFVSDLVTLFGKPGKPTRVIVAFTKYPTAFTPSSLCIRNENGTYTEAYKELTSEFHDRPLL